MHHVFGLSYVGRPTEAVSLTTQAAAGGQINVTLDGQPISGNAQFQLPSTAGSQSSMQIALFGPVGASCVVGIAEVDGGTDGDFLLCQAHDPAPVHFYTFSVASPAAVTTFAEVKAARAAPNRARAGKRSRPGKKRTQV